MTDQQTSRTNITEALDVAAQVAYEMSVFLHGAEMAPPVAPGWLAKIREWQARLAAEPRSDAVTAHAAYHREEPCDCETQPDEPSTWKELIAAGRASGIATAPDEPLPTFEELAASAPPLVKLLAWAESVRAQSAILRVEPPKASTRELKDLLRLAWDDLQEREARAAHLNPADSGSSASVPPLDELTQRFGAEMHRYFGELFSPDEHAAAKGIFRNTVAAAYAAETPEQGRGDESR